MSRAERGVILTLLGLAVAGHLVRLVAGGLPGSAPGAVGIPGAAPDSQLARHQAAAARAATALHPGETIDPDRAPVEELARLPGIGMALAKEIVADRELRGSFGSLEGLDRVRGIGPATLGRLEPFLRFPGNRPAAGRVNLNTASQAELEGLPGVGPTRARAILAYRERHGPFAAPGGLAGVPGMGSRLVERLRPLVRVR